MKVTKQEIIGFSVITLFMILLILGVTVNPWIFILPGLILAIKVDF